VLANLPVFTAASMEYVEEFILKGLNIRLLTKSAKRMPDNVDTTCEPTMYIYSLSQARSTLEKRTKYLVVVQPFFAKLD
jgi:hypothetical protein